MPTNNDPFDRIARIDEEDEANLERLRLEELEKTRQKEEERAHELEEARKAAEPKPAPAADEEIATTKTPRNIGKTAGAAIMPLAVLGILGWVFLAPNPGKKVVEQPKTFAVPNENDTEAFISGLKTPKVKPPLPSTAMISPVAVAAPAAGEMPPTISEADRQARTKEENEAKLREAQIDAAPLQSRGRFKTVKTTESGGSDNSVAQLTSRQAALRAQAADILASADPSGPGQGGASGAGRASGGAAAGAYAQRGQGAGGFGAGNYGGAGSLGGPGNDPGGPIGPVHSLDQDFMSEARASSSGENKVLRQQLPTAKYVIDQGTPIEAVLLTGITSDLPGDIRALVSYDVYDSRGFGAVLIPKGSTLVGKYNNQVVSGQQRLLVATTRLIRPDGTWISLAGANATDQIGQSGLEADVDNHFFRIFGTSLVLGAASYLLPSSDRNITSTIGLTGSQSGGSIAGQALNDTMKTLLERNKKIAPTLSTQIGSKFMFMASQDMVLTPYRSVAR